MAADYRVRHDHLYGGCSGVLTLDERGVSYREEAQKPRKHPHQWTWTYEDIQQLELAPKRVRVLTYTDNVWKLGADREYTFNAADGADFTAVYALLRNRLGQRLVAELAQAGAATLWQVPVKHLGRFGGEQGILTVNDDGVVYRSSGKGQARTWRYKDIDNISRSGSFELTITTFERARMHYGNRKDFNFQLKEPLDERRYDSLWRRVHFPAEAQRTQRTPPSIFEKEKQ